MKEYLKKPSYFLVIVVFLFLGIILIYPQLQKKKILLLRCDDIGLNHAINIAMEELIKYNIPFSASIICGAPDFKEAVEILRTYPEISVGVHLTLNSEWPNYKIKPLSPPEKIKSLIDEEGNFFASRTELFENNPVLNEIEIELRNQIKTALTSGLRIDYADFHMYTVVSTPELTTLALKLCMEYNLIPSGLYNEKIINELYLAHYSMKDKRLKEIFSQLESEKINVLVTHIRSNYYSDKHYSLHSYNNKDEKWKSRDEELKALVSYETRTYLQSSNIKLITYKDMTSQ